MIGEEAYDKRLLGIYQAHIVRDPVIAAGLMRDTDVLVADEPRDLGVKLLAGEDVLRIFTGLFIHKGPAVDLFQQHAHLIGGR